jgi:hypothetical protein
MMLGQYGTVSIRILYVDFFNFLKHSGNYTYVCITTFFNTQ